MKECRICNNQLSEECFSKNSRICRKCTAARNNSRYTLSCVVCSVEFTSAYQKTRFCSKRCQAAPRKKRVEVECPNCLKKHSIIKSRVEKTDRNYCSYQCRYSHMKVTMKGENHPNYNRLNRNCSGCSCEMKVIPYYANNKPLKFCSYSCYKKHIGDFFKGENSPSWDPELTEDERVRNRNLPEYRLWRSSVYERDGFKCVACGDAQGGNLVAHHKNSWDSHPTERFEVSNGVTLCDICHKRFHSAFGYGKNTEQQFKTFMIDLSFAKTR